MVHDQVGSGPGRGATNTIGYQEPNIECYNAYEDDALFRVLKNDPDVAGLNLRICEGEYIEGGNREWSDNLSRAIRSSSHLRRLNVVSESERPSDDLHLFCRALMYNRSLEHLSLSQFDLSESDICPMLAPFFEYNHKLRCIEITTSAMSDAFPSFISALCKSTKQVERIDLSDNDIGDEHARDLINAINGDSGGHLFSDMIYTIWREAPRVSRSPGLLHNLLDLCLGGNDIGRKGCKALRALMKNSACKIQVLNLRDNSLDNECIKILTQGLVENRSVKLLDITNQERVLPTGWYCFSVALSESNVSLEHIRLGSNKIGDRGFISLGIFVAKNKRLESLDLSLSTVVSSTGWSGFSNCLRSPDCGLVRLNLSECDIADEGFEVMAKALAQNTSLKMLNMSDNRNISSSGWREFFSLLMDSEIPLEELNLSRSCIDDIGAAPHFHPPVAHSSWYNWYH
ncbi:hypothetical protein ACHAXH_003301 [Discostella pseudostelligera]